MSNIIKPFESAVNKNPISITLGDITQANADAIVVPQFDDEVSYLGVGGAVVRNGAVGGMQFLETLLEKEGKFKVGTVVHAPAGGGNIPHLLHAISIDTGVDQEFSTMVRVMYNALSVAKDKGIKSIAAPALGTGTMGALTPNQSARAMMYGIELYSKSAEACPIPVQFYIYGDLGAYNDFCDVARSKTYTNSSLAERGEKDFDFVAFHERAVMDRMANVQQFGSGESPVNPKAKQAPHPAKLSY